MGWGLDILILTLLVTAAVTDLIWGKIFNLVTLPFLITGVIYRFATAGVKGGGSALLAVLVAFALFFPLYRLSAMAAADVKLLMAFGAWAEVKAVIHLAATSILVGALVGIVLLIRNVGIRDGARNVFRHLRSRSEPLVSHRMPFAPAFLCGFFILKIAEHYRWQIF